MVTNTGTKIKLTKKQTETMTDVHIYMHYFETTSLPSITELASNAEVTVASLKERLESLKTKGALQFKYCPYCGLKLKFSVKKKPLTEGQIKYRRYKKSEKAYRSVHKDKWLEYRDNQFFGGMKKLALERDGYKCRECGMTHEEHLSKWKLGITVDHIDGQGRNSKVKNNNLDNLKTLCLSCHGKKDYERYRRSKLETGL